MKSLSPANRKNHLATATKITIESQENNHAIEMIEDFRSVQPGHPDQGDRRGWRRRQRRGAHDRAPCRGGIHCANTDAQACCAVRRTRPSSWAVTGLGAGSKPDKGREAAEGRPTSAKTPSKAPTCCSSPPAWAAAPAPGAPRDCPRTRRNGHPHGGRGDQAVRVGRRRRMTNADAGLAELEANVDSLIVVLNESCWMCWATTCPRKSRLCPRQRRAQKRRGRHCRDHQRARQRERRL